MEFVEEWRGFDDNQISSASNEFQAQPFRVALNDDEVYYFYLMKLAEIDLSLAIETVICDWNVTVAQITGHLSDPFFDPVSISTSDKLLDRRFLPHSENFNSKEPAEIVEESKPPTLCNSHRQSSFKRPADALSQRIARKETFAYQPVRHCYNRDKSDNWDNTCSDGSFTEGLSYSPSLCKWTLPRALVDSCVEQAVEEETPISQEPLSPIPTVERTRFSHSSWSKISNRLQKKQPAPKAHPAVSVTAIKWKKLF